MTPPPRDVPARAASRTAPCCLPTPRDEQRQARRKGPDLAQLARVGGTDEQAAVTVAVPRGLGQFRNVLVQGRPSGEQVLQFAAARVRGPAKYDHAAVEAIEIGSQCVPAEVGLDGDASLQSLQGVCLSRPTARHVRQCPRLPLSCSRFPVWRRGAARAGR